METPGLDTEIKNSAIDNIGYLLNIFGENMSGDDFAKILDLLLKKMSNELSRMNSLNVISQIHINAQLDLKNASVQKVFEQLVKEIS